MLLLLPLNLGVNKGTDNGESVLSSEIQKQTLSHLLLWVNANCKRESCNIFSLFKENFSFCYCLLPFRLCLIYWANEQQHVAEAKGVLNFLLAGFCVFFDLLLFFSCTIYCFYYLLGMYFILMSELLKYTVFMFQFDKIDV